MIINSITDRKVLLNSFHLNRAFARDVTVAILVFHNNEMAAILVSQTNPKGLIKLWAGLFKAGLS